MLDIQSTKVAARFAIESVGVTNLRYPLTITDGGEQQTTAANWRLSVTLPADRRGTHMSRFVAALEARAEQATSLQDHYQFASQLVGLLDAPSAEVSTDFTWFRTVKAPVSGLKSRLECQVTFTSRAGDDAHKTIAVQIAAKALCPCSKAISERGAHNQRSDIRLTLRFASDALVPPIDRLLTLAESGASSPIYPLLKRDDEKFVTEAAYDNPVFVEDLVRAVAEKLVDLPAKAFAVEALNRESIHAHDCFARIAFTR